MMRFFNPKSTKTKNVQNHIKGNEKYKKTFDGDEIFW